MLLRVSLGPGDGQGMSTLRSGLRASFSPCLPRIWRLPWGERVFLRSTDGRVGLRPNLPLSGVSALRELTMIADDPWVTYAAYPASHTLSVLLAEGWEVAEEGDSPDILVESWAHAFPRLRFFSPG